MISCELFGDLEFRFDEGIRFLDILEVGYYLIQNWKFDYDPKILKLPTQSRFSLSQPAVV